jgi:hypothetical protein
LSWVIDDGVGIDEGLFAFLCAEKTYVTAIETMVFVLE